jgi:hypothetical protein
LPDNAFPLIERVALKAGKTPYVRSDLNGYTVPHRKAQRLLTPLADPDTGRVVAAPTPSLSSPQLHKGAQIEDPAHLQALVNEKCAARRRRGVDGLAAGVPAAHPLLQGAP